MIPAPVPPLTGLSVLVTRPADQAISLCGRIQQMGGEAVAFPALAIEPIAVEITIGVDRPRYDYAIFLSANAVLHGVRHLCTHDDLCVAAIGQATASALRAAGVSVDIVPDGLADSEALLAALQPMITPGRTVMLIKGAGGRDLLHETLRARGMQVDIVEVYRRVVPRVSASDVEQFEQRWLTQGIDVVTLTSGEILANLDTLLSSTGKQLLRSSPFLTVSERLIGIARDRGLLGPALLARPMEEAMLGVLAQWHARARDSR
jgi:uroporphyrinogen-III synthase